MPGKERDVRNGATAAADEGAQAEKSDSKGKSDKGKKAISFRLRKGTKASHRGIKHKSISVNSGCGFATSSCVGGGAWRCSCPKGRCSLDSSAGESPAGDPNSSAFSFGTLKSLIEKNDFYSKECNPHSIADQKNR